MRPNTRSNEPHTSIHIVDDAPVRGRFPAAKTGVVVGVTELPATTGVVEVEELLDELEELLDDELLELEELLERVDEVLEDEEEEEEADLVVDDDDEVVLLPATMAHLSFAGVSVSSWVIVNWMFQYLSSCVVDAGPAVQAMPTL